MAGAPPPAGALRAVLARVAARLTTPFVYLAVLGGLQVLLLSVLHPLYSWWPAVILAAGWLGLLVTISVVRERWRAKLAGLSVLAIVSAVLPTALGILIRSRSRLTSEHDGLLQVESAIDRLLNGHPIYGVDWSSTPMASFPWSLTPG